jgi:hypothetical protein
VPLPAAGAAGANLRECSRIGQRDGKARTRGRCCNAASGLDRLTRAG